MMNNNVEFPAWASIGVPEFPSPMLDAPCAFETFSLASFSCCSMPPPCKDPPPPYPCAFTNWIAGTAKPALIKVTIAIVAMNIGLFIMKYSACNYLTFWYISILIKTPSKPREMNNPVYLQTYFMGWFSTTFAKLIFLVTFKIYVQKLLIYGTDTCSY